MLNKRTIKVSDDKYSIVSCYRWWAFCDIEIATTLDNKKNSDKQNERIIYTKVFLFLFSIKTVKKHTAHTFKRTFDENSMLEFASILIYRIEQANI